MEREHHRNARHVGAIVNVDLARVQTPLELLAAHAQALACLFIYSLIPLLGAQLADLVVSSGSHCKHSLEGIDRQGRLLDRPLYGSMRVLRRVDRDRLGGDRRPAEPCPTHAAATSCSARVFSGPSSSARARVPCAPRTCCPSL